MNRDTTEKSQGIRINHKTGKIKSIKKNRIRRSLPTPRTSKSSEQRSARGRFLIKSRTQL